MLLVVVVDAGRVVVVVVGAVLVVVVFCGRVVVDVVLDEGGLVGSGVGVGVGRGATNWSAGTEGTSAGGGGGGGGTGGAGGGGGSSPRRRRLSASGEATGRPRTGTPARPVRIRSPKIAAGKLPPVTDRPCTLVIGLAGSWPTHTAVATWGT